MVSAETVWRQYGDCLETVWRQCGDSVESDAFYGDFMVKLVWRLSGVFMEKT